MRPMSGARFRITRDSERAALRIHPGKRRPRNETTGVLYRPVPQHPAGTPPASTSPHLQPALIEFNGEGRARVEVSWISMIHFSRPSPAANAAKSVAPRLMLFEPAPSRETRHLPAGISLVQRHESDRRHRSLHARARRVPGPRPGP